MLGCNLSLLNKSHTAIECVVKSGCISDTDAVNLSKTCKAFNRGVYETDIRNAKKGVVRFTNIVGNETRVECNGNTTFKKAVDDFLKKFGREGHHIKVIENKEIIYNSKDEDKDKEEAKILYSLNPPRIVYVVIGMKEGVSL